MSETQQAPQAQHIAQAPRQTDEIRGINRVLLVPLTKHCPDLVDWARRLAGHGGNLVDAAQLSAGDDGEPTPVFHIRFFTERYRYSIAARAPADGNDGYLGCTASARKPLAGEDWTRGNDLAGGPYCEDTWNAIVHDILGYELVRLGK